MGDGSLSPTIRDIKVPSYTHRAEYTPWAEPLGTAAERGREETLTLLVATHKARESEVHK